MFLLFSRLVRLSHKLSNFSSHSQKKKTNTQQKNKLSTCILSKVCFKRLLLFLFTSEFSVLLWHLKSWTIVKCWKRGRKSFKNSQENMNKKWKFLIARVHASIKFQIDKLLIDDLETFLEFFDCRIGNWACFHSSFLSRTYVFLPIFDHINW